MTGWKTWAGGIIAIGCGMYLLVLTESKEFGMAMISAGLMGIGIAHKIEKTKQ